MKVAYKNTPINIFKTESKVNIVRVGVRSIYEEQGTSQQYVKCFSKWWKFPQEIEY